MFEIKMLAGLVHLEAPLLGLEVALFSLCLYEVFVSVYLSPLLLMNLIRLGISFFCQSYWIRAYPNDLIKGSYFQTQALLRY